jgi:hypothetical protein
MSSKWQMAMFETCPGGVSSAVQPELLPPGQFAWGMNIAIRGGKPHTRPSIIERMTLPSGLHQASSYFGVQDGMIVTSIDGRIYRLRIGNNTFSYENIPLGFVNSGIIKQAWMQQTIESLVIQDGQSNAIIYNGSTARRAGSDEVPRGTAMAYGNGRLWVAINKKELVAGDIRTRTAGSELFFTETNYLSGGGSLYFPRGITGLEFIPVTGAADFGTLIVFGRDYAESIRADVTSRDMWPQMAGFVTNVFRDIGCAGDWSIVQVNQDLYWRDARGDIRSLANAISTNSSPGSTPVSREVQRIVAFDSDQLLQWVSAIYFDNRLLMTASPYLNRQAGISFKDIVALDFSPISTMQLKAPPAYDGTWTGIPGAAQLVTGEFDGVNRAFCISSGEDGQNRLWEILTTGRDDVYLSCGSSAVNEPVTTLIEYPSVDFGAKKNRKRIERLDVYLSGIDGELDMVAYWRTDNTQKWSRWDEKQVCAKTTDAAVNTPHTWKNLLPEQRPQIKTFTIPDGVDEVTRYGLQVGFEFQIRLVITGEFQVEKLLMLATVLDDPDFADELVTECIENDVTGNEIRYIIPAIVCPPDPPLDPIFEQYDGPFVGIRFLNEIAEGENRVIYSGAFLGVDHSHAAGTIPVIPPSSGVVGTQWSGESTYNLNTDSYEGGIAVIRVQSGVIPAGVNYSVPGGPPIELTRDTFDLAYQAILQQPGTSFAARSYTEGSRADGSFVRKWFSETPGPAVDGYFAGGAMAAIWSDGWTLIVTSRDLVTPAQLGLPIERTGDPARTQHITGYDPVTFTYTGTKSRVRQDVGIPIGKTKLYGDFVFQVTPDDGSGAYFLYVSQEFDVLGGATYNAVTWFPWIVDAEVYYVSGSFSFTPSYYLGWGNQSDVEYTELPGSSTWPELVDFGMPTPNGEAWDDFQDYAQNDTIGSAAIITLFTGYGWEDDYIFNTADPIDAYDDFQAYADGPIGNLTQGVGWAAAGFVFLIPTPDVFDDFQSYATGPITVLDVYGDFWAANGFFIT